MSKPDGDKRLDREQLLHQVEDLIEARAFEALKELLAEARSNDVAEVVEVLDEMARQVLFDLLDPDTAGDVIDDLDEATRSDVVEDLSHDQITDIVSALPPDEAADFVSELPEQEAEQVLEDISPAESDEIEKLLEYPEDSAGGIMTPELIKVSIDDTIADAIATIRQSDPEEDFYFAFVCDAHNALKGTIGMRSLIRHRPDTPVRDVMKTDVLTVTADADQEEIANLVRKHDLIALGVVDEKGVLLGRITVDDVMDVMEEEAEEDALVMAGTHPDELDKHSVFRAARIRLPWLLTCMAGAMISTIVLVEAFRVYFSAAEWISIFMFLPAIMAMGGNSGLQTSTIVVRGLATGDLAALKISTVFIRESRVALIVAIFCGLLAGVVSSLVLTQWHGELDPAKAPILGLSVGLAMFFGIMLCTCLGFLLPFFFRKVGIDPAVSSGPLVTTANDALGNCTYLTLSLLLLRLLA